MSLQLLGTPCLPDFSPISMYPCIPGDVPALGAGDLFLSNNPFLGIPSASGSFTVEQLTHLCHGGFDMCCTHAVCLRIQIWSSEEGSFHPFPCHALLSSTADISSLLCPRLQVPASCEWCLKGSNTMMSARERIQPVQEHEEAGKNVKDEVFSAFQKEKWEIGLGNRAGGVRTG